MTSYGKGSGYVCDESTITQRAAHPGPLCPQPQREEKAEKKSQESAYTKGKEQRRADAQRRREYAEVEKLVTQLEREVWSLEQQIASPEAAADYLLLQELCAQAEEKRDALSKAEDRWLELSEE